MSKTTPDSGQPVPEAPVDEYLKLLEYLRAANGTMEMEYEEFRRRLHVFLDESELRNQKFLEFVTYTEAFLKRHFPQ